MNFTFDGVPTSFLLHTVQQVQDGGSIAMLNGDILDGITLLNGSYPQRYGNRLGAELDFHMREGSRDRTQLRFGVSGTDASVVAEGPLGRREGGIVAGLGAQELSRAAAEADRRRDDDFGFGFSDIQSKLVYDVAPAHRVELTIVAGRSRLDQDEHRRTAERGPATAATAPCSSTPAGGSPSRRASSSPSAWRSALNDYSNVNAAGGEHRIAGADATSRGGPTVAAIRSTALTLEGGAQVQWQHRDLIGRSPARPGSAP